MSHWDAWGTHGGLKHVSLPCPDSKPEAAMALLLAKVRLLHGEQDWPAWTWEAWEYASPPGRPPRRLAFQFEGDRFVVLSPAEEKMAG